MRPNYTACWCASCSFGPGSSFGSHFWSGSSLGGYVLTGGPQIWQIMEFQEILSLWKNHGKFMKLHSNLWKIKKLIIHRSYCFRLDLKIVLSVAIWTVQNQLWMYTFFFFYDIIANKKNTIQTVTIIYWRLSKIQTNTSRCNSKVRWEVFTEQNTDTHCLYRNSLFVDQKSVEFPGISKYFWAQIQNKIKQKMNAFDHFK